MVEVEEPKWSSKGLKVVENGGELGHKRREIVESQIGGPLEGEIVVVKSKKCLPRTLIFYTTSALTSSVK